MNSEEPKLTLDGQAIACDPKSVETIIPFAIELVLKKCPKIDAVVHRVVHGGSDFSQPVLITEEVLSTIKQNTPLAPLHNPANLLGIYAAQAILPQTKHVAIFDTAFHSTLPTRAREYALSEELRSKHKLRRYGFHGTSHSYVATRAAEFLKTDLKDLRVISCHLGNGCSLAAIEYSRSVETSMGFTPLEGLVMGTRCGDLDAGIILSLMQSGEYSADQLERILNKESGLKGLTAGTSDMRDIIENAENGDEPSRLALHVFSHRLRKYIGAYAAVMGGVDAIVFTGGIGENSSVIRHRATQRLHFLGAIIDEDKNRDITLSSKNDVDEFSVEHSRVKLLAVKTDEQLSMAQMAHALINKSATVADLSIPIAISARHIHLTQESVEILFGKGHQLRARNALSQPGQFAAEETVDIIGPKQTIEHVRILGPARSINQVEISRTDEFTLGVDAPVRASGKIDNTPGITLEGPNGRLTLEKGLICAWRHIHMHPNDAVRFQVS
ncbi:UNVERIFIED_CONTAM: hypothetical protein GTU68_043494 [Idotea baltica]|nr:hypothetical protein [Idotea baltica]